MKEWLDFLVWLIVFCVVYGVLMLLMAIMIAPPWEYKNCKAWLKELFHEEED